ncbi:molybdopterin synthase [Methanosalsum natronophilum]|uniref:molybdopterin synthase n=1 Tax=Methanosalsum natronophilum TaxID=768733 RepID=UPI0021681B9F|nr:molybdopterin synthase [Methanosalsum natronophilum]MCS3924625.1 molybdopterin synthase catalytic subunit [Methanosalsum natronophilum]
MKVIAIVGKKDSGKTTIVSTIVKKLSEKGPVGTIKYMKNHNFLDIDTDTGKHFEAGSNVVTGILDDGMITYSKKISLTDAIENMANSGIKYLIIEGGKKTRVPKILVGNLPSNERIDNIKAHIDSFNEQEIESAIQIIYSLEDTVTLNSLINRVKSNSNIKKAGAVGTFTGIVREITGNLQTQRLVFEKYDILAQKQIKEITDKLKQQEGIVDVLIHHKSGHIEPAEDIVYIVVAASHRQQLFPVLSEAIELVKEKVPIWKKEFTFDGEFWVHDKN